MRSLSPVVMRIEENLIEFFRHLARNREGGEVREAAGVSFASCGATFHMFNGAFLSTAVRDAAELEQRIVTAAEHFERRKLRWAFWVNEEKLEGNLCRLARGVFHNHGLGLSSRMPAMIAGGLKPPARRLPPIEIRRIDNEETRAAFCHIVSAAFSIPFEWSRELYGSARTWDGALSGYLSYAGGEVVSAAAAMAAAGALGLYCVATLPGHERKGYAEAIVRHAVGEARSRLGLRYSVLQSTAVGLPLYQRLGYEIVSHFAVYTR